MSESSNPTPDAIPTNNTASQLGAVLLMIVAMIQWLAIAGVMIWVVPKFTAIYADFGSQLSTITLLLIRGRMLLAVASVLLVIAMLIGLVVRPRSSVLLWFYGLAFVAGFAMMGLVGISLFASLPMLIEAAQNS